MAHVTILKRRNTINSIFVLAVCQFYNAKVSPTGFTIETFMNKMFGGFGLEKELEVVDESIRTVLTAINNANTLTDIKILLSTNCPEMKIDLRVME